jgi:hypothetical protein
VGLRFPGFKSFNFQRSTELFRPTKFSMSTRPILLTLLIFVAIAVAPALRAASWSDLGALHDLGPGITPGIDVDRAGVIHLVHMHDGAIFYRRGDGHGRFGEAELVPAPEGAANYNSPHLVAAADGSLHLVFVRDSRGKAGKRGTPSGAMGAGANRWPQSMSRAPIAAGSTCPIDIMRAATAASPSSLRVLISSSRRSSSHRGDKTAAVEPASRDRAERRSV